jgi:hypothetical protein
MYTINLPLKNSAHKSMFVLHSFPRQQIVISKAKPAALRAIQQFFLWMGQSF